MHSKFLTIIIFFNIIFSQALLNRAIGNDLIFGSPRAYAMGITNSLNGKNSSLTRYNPSLLKESLGSKPSLIDFQLNINSVSERRSILVKDYFGDFLTYADYVNNTNMYNYFQGGFVSNVGDKVALGFSFLPFTSFNYDYIEEVRGSADIEDGDVGLKDPLEGFHQFKTSGNINTLSFGFSFSENLGNMQNISFGVGFNQTLNMSITDEFRIDTLSTDFENLSFAKSYYSDESLETLANFFSFGLSYSKRDFLLSMNMEGDLLIQTPNFKSYNFIDSIGIITYLDSTNTDFIVKGINYYKPMQYHFGFSYNPKDNSDLTVSTEIQYNKFDFPSINYFKNSLIYKFGFEYFLPSNIPLRAGLIYKQSPIQALPDQSIITWGSGLIHGQFECDFSFSYTFYDYYYPTLFSVENNQIQGFDQITDSNFNFILGVKYYLK